MLGLGPARELPMGVDNQLVDLRQDTGQRLPTSVVMGLTQFASAALPVRVSSSGGVYVAKRTSSTDRRVRATQRLKSFQAEHDRNFMGMLNDALLGASDYPVLNAVLGTAVGIGTGGASFIFTVSTTALSMAKTSARVLARDGDEVWRVEEIGKSTFGGKPVLTYLLAYFLVDPFRRESMAHKGWLLHEARYPLQE